MFVLHQLNIAKIYILYCLKRHFLIFISDSLYKALTQTLQDHYVIAWQILKKAFAYFEHFIIGSTLSLFRSASEVEDVPE